MSTLKLSYDDQTEELLKFILDQLDETALDSIEVDREFSEPEGLASEPITVGVILTLSPVIIVTVGRLVERWMENKRQEKQIEELRKAFAESNKTGRAIQELMISQNTVSATFGPLPPIPNGKP